jgi:TonB family protein
MIRSVVTTLLIVAAFVGGALATVQIGRYCETSGSPWRSDELARCIGTETAESVHADAESGTPARPVPTRLNRPEPEAAEPDEIAAPEPRIAAALQPHAFQAPAPILLRQDRPEKESRAGEVEPQSVEPAPIVVIPTSVPKPRDDAEVRRLLAQHYPTALASAGAGGMVVLSLMISTEGHARAPEVVSGSGVDALDAAALEVARRVRFTPAVQQGRTVEARILFPVVFAPS